MAAGVTPLAKYKLVFLGVGHDPTHLRGCYNASPYSSQPSELREPLPFAPRLTRATTAPVLYFFFFLQVILFFSLSSAVYFHFPHGDGAGAVKGRRSCAVCERAISPKTIHEMVSVTPYCRLRVPFLFLPRESSHLSVLIYRSAAGCPPGRQHQSSGPPSPWSCLSLFFFLFSKIFL